MGHVLGVNAPKTCLRAQHLIQKRKSKLRKNVPMIWWEKGESCKTGMSSNYHPHYHTFLRITSPTLVLKESGLNWFSSCKGQQHQPSEVSCLQTRSFDTFPTVTVCVAWEDSDPDTLLGAVDAGEGVESWLETALARPMRNKESRTEAILICIDPGNAGKM